MKPIIIIGAGLAGWTTAREFRKLDTTTPIVIITADSGDFYAKPSLSNAFAQKRTPEQLVSTPAAKMAETLAVTLMPRTTVLALDTAGCTVTVMRAGEEESAGPGQAQTLGFSQLVLATGAQPVRVAVAGTAANQVRSVNSLDDFSAFYGALLAAKPGGTSAISSEFDSKLVVIMGAGLIGCEYANDLVLGGHRVEVVDLAERPLALLVPPAAGLQLQQALAALGVSWHFGTTVQAVDGPAQNASSAPVPMQKLEPRTAETSTSTSTPTTSSISATPSPLTVTLGNGRILAADIVLSAVGLRADTALARAAGLDCDRGIVVNDLLQTSAPRVFALGDCAQYASAGQRTLPYVMPIMNAARALAATLAGNATPLVFPLMPVSVKTPALPMVVAVPAPEHPGQWIQDNAVDAAPIAVVTTPTATPTSATSDISTASTALNASTTPSGVWRFVDTTQAQRGFVLSGKQTSRRMELAKLTLV